MGHPDSWDESRSSVKDMPTLICRQRGKRERVREKEGEREGEIKSRAGL